MINVTLDGSVAPNLRYNRNKFVVNVGLPINYNFVQVNNKIVQQKTNKNLIHFQPSLFVKYQITGKADVSVEYNIGHHTGDLSTLYTGYILQNYRSLNHYDNYLSKSRNDNVHFSLSYKDVMKMFFINGSVTYSYRNSDVLYGQIFKDRLTLTSAIKQDNSAYGVSVNSRASKGFYWIGMTTALQASYSTYLSEQLRQGALVKYDNDALNISGTVSANPTSWLYFEYKGTWNRNWSKIRSQEAFTPIRTFVNATSADIQLPKAISLYVGYEHYYNSAAKGNRNLIVTYPLLTLD